MLQEETKTSPCFHHCESHSSIFFKTFSTIYQSNPFQSVFVQLILIFIIHSKFIFKARKSSFSMLDLANVIFEFEEFTQYRSINVDQIINTLSYSSFPFSVNGAKHAYELPCFENSSKLQSPKFAEPLTLTKIKL